MRRVIAAFVAAALISGHGLASQLEQTAQVASLEIQARAATDDCDRKFQPGDRSVATARAKCLNDALEILAPALGYDDLIRLYVAARMAIAERFEAGLISYAQAEKELSREITKVVAETKRRGGER